MEEDKSFAKKKCENKHVPNSQEWRKMKKELIICILIIAVIIITNVITQNYTKECVSQMNERLDVLKESSLDKNNINEENIVAEIQNIENKWNEFQEKLAFYIEHDELEKVETQIFAMKGFAEIKKYDEIVPELDKCIFILEHIQDKTVLNIKNVF